MNRPQSIKYLYQFIFCLIVLSSGCVNMVETPLHTYTPYQSTEIHLRTQTNTPIKVLPSLTPSLTQTPNIPTGTPSPTNTQIPPSHTWTPLSTLVPEAAQELYYELLENNAGCRLPCWWGIIPGQTSGEKAQRYLETFTHINIRNISDDLHIISALIPLPEEYGTIRHKYVVRRGIVDEISAYNFDLAPNLYMTNFLKIYGPPDEIWIRTVRHREMGSQPFIIDLYYPEKGILMEYSGGNVEIRGDYLRNCFEDMYAPFINLWSTDSNLTTDDVIEIFLDTENLPHPVLLSEATDMDIDTFYNVLTSGNTLCIKTPQEIWP